MRKSLSLTLAVGYTASLTILSLIKLNRLPKFGSSFDDKIYHSLAYVLLTLLWYSVLSHTSVKFKIILSATIAIVYGIIIEVLQGALTQFRTPDINDVFANTFGAIIAIVLLILYRKIKLK